MQIVAVSPAQRPSFTFPPRQFTFSSPANGEDIQMNDIKSPQTLVDAILKVDGRIARPPNGNAWKEIRCFRRNQDLGSLWEIREIYHERGANVASSA